ncbi:helix-turn-helix transcriptional regulator [Chitinophaga sp.]|uniref:helix-turn-helix transcriptional regulator n=1 Tax=Chitinophaga sp. TaxID=1869181 RepID=UPI0031CEFE9F
MTYRELKPGKPLQAYVKCYYIYESVSSVTFDDLVFPSGNTEVIFNLGSGSWQTRPGDQFVTTPPVELWGQLVTPLPVRSIGCNTMLGVRFYPHGAVAILHDKIDQFNNQVIDATDVLGNVTRSLHTQLLNTPDWQQRIELLEAFLIQQLTTAEKKLPKIAMIYDMMNELQQTPYLSMETIAGRYGISARYMQQLFVHHTGLTPKLYSQITRFQKSLQLVTANEMSLTAVAYECGYADQSHFIREFKSFTGSTPSALV